MSKRDRFLVGRAVLGLLLMFIALFLIKSPLLGDIILAVGVLINAWVMADMYQSFLGKGVRWAVVLYFLAWTLLAAALASGLRTIETEWSLLIFMVVVTLASMTIGLVVICSINSGRNLIRRVRKTPKKP